MMIDPCTKCIVTIMCKEYCESKLDYYVYVIKDFNEHGTSSKIFQDATLYVQRRVRDMVLSMSYSGYTVFMKKWDSKELYRMDKDGITPHERRNKVINNFKKG